MGRAVCVYMYVGRGAGVGDGERGEEGIGGGGDPIKCVIAEINYLVGNHSNFSNGME